MHARTYRLEYMHRLIRPDLTIEVLLYDFIRATGLPSSRVYYFFLLFLLQSYLVFVIISYYSSFFYLSIVVMLY